MRPFTFNKPSSYRLALSAGNSTARYIAGGTNLVDLMKKNITAPEQVIDITGVLPAEIKSTGNGIRIGAMARNSAITLSPLVLSSFPLLAKAILAGASPQIRNMATTGGNMMQRTRCPYFYDTTLPCNKRNPGSGCGALKGDHRMGAIIGYSDQCVAVHPSDMCVALAALDARITYRDRNNKPVTILFTDFHRLPGMNPQSDNNLPEGAIIETIDIPNNKFNEHYAYLKIRDRESYAFALISVAAAIQLSGNRISDVRLASGGVAHKPWRWQKAEQFLKGKEATTANFRAAASIASGDTKPLQKNKFKALMLQGAIETALQNCLTA